jgi:hypothetical protein
LSLLDSRYDRTPLVCSRSIVATDVAQEATAGPGLEGGRSRDGDRVHAGSQQVAEAVVRRHTGPVLRDLPDPLR